MLLCHAADGDCAPVAKRKLNTLQGLRIVVNLDFFFYKTICARQNSMKMCHGKHLNNSYSIVLEKEITFEAAIRLEKLQKSHGLCLISSIQAQCLLLVTGAYSKSPTSVL